nr:MAG TPA: hypothetical protein [Caudoviricetes sp.]
MVDLRAGAPVTFRLAHARLLSLLSWLQQRCTFSRLRRSVALPPRLTGIISSTSVLIGLGHAIASSIGLSQMAQGVCCLCSIRN